MRLEIIIIAATGLTMLATSCRRSEKALPSPPSALSPQDTWQVESIDSGDGPTEVHSIKLVWTEEELFMLGPTGDKKMMGVVVRVDTKATPAAIDMTGPEGQTGLGIFECAGETM